MVSLSSLYCFSLSLHSSCPSPSLSYIIISLTHTTSILRANLVVQLARFLYSLSRYNFTQATLYCKSLQFHVHHAQIIVLCFSTLQWYESLSLFLVLSSSFISVTHSFSPPPPPPPSLPPSLSLSLLPLSLPLSISMSACATLDYNKPLCSLPPPPPAAGEEVRSDWSLPDECYPHFGLHCPPSHGPLYSLRHPVSVCV